MRCGTFETAPACADDNAFTQLAYQMTRISYARGSLKLEDRLDGLAWSCSFWIERMGIDAHRGLKEHQDDAFDAELRDFVAHATGRPSRGGPRWARTQGR